MIIYVWQINLIIYTVTRNKMHNLFADVSIIDVTRVIVMEWQTFAEHRFRVSRRDFSTTDKSGGYIYRTLTKRHNINRWLKMSMFIYFNVSNVKKNRWNNTKVKLKRWSRVNMSWGNNWNNREYVKKKKNKKTRREKQKL